MEDKDLAWSMLTESLKRVGEINLFGNGFPLGPFPEKIAGVAYRTEFMAFGPKFNDKNEKPKEGSNKYNKPKFKFEK